MAVGGREGCCREATKKSHIGTRLISQMRATAINDANNPTTKARAEMKNTRGLTVKSAKAFPGRCINQASNMYRSAI
jgi:hypothetical protein